MTVNGSRCLSPLMGCRKVGGKKAGRFFLGDWRLQLKARPGVWWVMQRIACGRKGFNRSLFGPAYGGIANRAAGSARLSTAPPTPPRLIVG